MESVPLAWPANLVLWIVLAGALLGLVGSRIRVQVLITLAVLTLTGFLSVWILAFQTSTYEARIAFGGVPALAILAAFGLQRWKLPIRFVLPLLGLCGTITAVQHDVLGVHWP